MAEEKKPDPGAVDFDALPKLSPKDMAFVIAYMKTGDATASYEKVWGKGKRNRRTLIVRAAHKKASDNVATTIRALTLAGAATASVTLEGHLAELERIKALAIADGKYSPAIDAEKSRGRVAGLYVDQIEISKVSELSDAELAAELVRETGVTLVEALAMIGADATETRH